MTDDTLRMRAVVEDGYTAPLANLRKQLRTVGTNSTGRAVAKDWKGVGKEITGVANTLRFGVAGAFRAVGMGSLAAGIGVAGVGAGLVGVVLGVRKLAGETRGLRIFSDQVGLSVQQLRVLKVVTDHAGMSWDTARGSLKSFSNSLFELRRHYGEAYNQLRGMNLAGLAEGLAKAPDMQTALKRAMEGIKSIKDPVLQRRVAGILLGTDQWAVVARETSAKLQQEIEQMLKALPKGSTEAADKFAGDMTRIGVELENLRTQFLAPLLPPFERLIKLMAGAGASGSGIVGKAGSLLGSILGGVVTGIETLVVPPKAMMGPADKLKQDEKALKTVQRLIEDAKKRGDPVPAHRLRKEEELIKSVDGLRKTLEKTNSDALLQKSSFNGIGLGGGGVIAAAYHGGGLGIGGGYGMRPRGGSQPMGRASRGNRGGIGATAGREGRDVARDSTGAGLGGSDFLKARRQRYADEIARTPGLRDRLGGMLALEGTPQPTMESLLNRTDYINSAREKQGKPPRTVDQMLTGGFYGPINRGQLPGGIARYRRNPRQFDQAIDGALGGSNIIEGYTDQGMPTDPNGSVTQMRKHGFVRPYKRIGGNEFPDFDGGPGGHASARRYREWQQHMVAQGSLAPASSTVAMLGAARRAEAARTVHRVEGSASLKIDLNGLPEGSKLRSQHGGMFREVQISRGRPMQSVWDR